MANMGWLLSRIRSPTLYRIYFIHRTPFNTEYNGIGDFSDDKSLFGCYALIPTWFQKLSRFHRFALYMYYNIIHYT